MPFILKKTMEMRSGKKIRFSRPVGMKLWGTPGGDVRYICGTEGHAVYVIEQRPGRRKILWDEGPHTLWFPWIYFFVKVSKDMHTSTSAPAYILISHEKQKTLEEKTLMVPYLPNLFFHGGICPNHNQPVRGIKPAVVARKFIAWFWRSRGTHVFEEFMVEPQNSKGDFLDPVIDAWSKLSSKQVLQTQFQSARYQSVKEAAHNLRFEYWERGGGGVNDMLTTIEPPVREEIK